MSYVLALYASLLGLAYMHVLVSDQYVLGLFWVALDISFMLRIAVGNWPCTLRVSVIHACYP